MRDVSNRLRKLAVAATAVAAMAAVALVNPGDAAAATKGATTAVATSQHSTVKIAPRHGDSWDW